MGDYRVNLDIFSGPLDLLLYLVRKEEVDIYDISLTTITDQYLRYLGMFKSLDIDLASDFLVMAATLMQIKSAMLLPKADIDQAGGEDAIDGRAELIRQLLEYKRFKDAANLLDAASDRRKERFTRPNTVIERLKPDTEPEVDLEQVSIWDLLEAFDSLIAATGGAQIDISHISDDTPIDLYQIEILHRLQTEGAMSFVRIFEGRRDRPAMIGLFLALLELIREKLVWTEQTQTCGPIYLKSLTDKPAEQAVLDAITALNDEPENQQPEQTSRRPAVIIQQIDAVQKSKQTLTTDSDRQTKSTISELPSENKPSASPEKPRTEAVDGSKTVNTE